MPVVINGSTGISGTDGSASTPAVQGTDTNTGLFFPAADTIAFAEGGTEVMRIDSAGNVGINYTNMSSLGTRLFVNGMSGFAATANGSPALGSRSSFTSTFENFSGGYGLGVQVSAATGAVTLQSQRLDGVATAYDVALNPLGGNVGIGTSAPTQRLSVDGNATFTGTAVMASSFLRNRIINGQQQVDQRNAGASASVASGAAVYTTDRNGVYNGGPNTITVQRVTGAAGFQNALRVTGSASNVGVSWFHRIEAGNSFDLASVSVTFSAWVWASTSRNVTPSISTPNSFENFASQTTGGSTTWAVTTTPTRFLWTFTMPANAVNGAEIAIALGVLLAGETVTLTGAQLEVGTVATPFERRQLGHELELCQRYFQVYGTGMIGRWTNASLCEVFSTRPAMRTAPTITLNSSSALMFRISLESFLATGLTITFAQTSINGVGIGLSKTGGGSPNPGEFAALMTDIIFANAEL